MEKEFDAKVVLVNYECDFCHKGLLQNIGSEYVQTDDGGDMIYKHICPNCGTVVEFTNISYPFPKVIPINV